MCHTADGLNVRPSFVRRQCISPSKRARSRPGHISNGCREYPPPLLETFIHPAPVPVATPVHSNVQSGSIRTRRRVVVSSSTLRLAPQTRPHAPSALATGHFCYSWRFAFAPCLDNFNTPCTPS
ncbi:unnamed protein product [Hapterophycus canaliculatus]